MKRPFRLILYALLALIVLVYLIDWTTLRIRISHGTAFGTVNVDQFLATPLKGNKDEYDFMGTLSEPCSHSIFPHGAPACWWLAKHTSRWE